MGMGAPRATSEVSGDTAGTPGVRGDTCDPPQCQGCPLPVPAVAERPGTGGSSGGAGNKKPECFGTVSHLWGQRGQDGTGTGEQDKDGDGGTGQRWTETGQERWRGQNGDEDGETMTGTRRG